jgi:SpoIID/LytB domain protein
MLGLTRASVSSETQVNLPLKIGIVQRFGENPQDQLIFQSSSGDHLNISFLDKNNQLKTLPTNRIKFILKNVPVRKPYLEERLILGNFRSFETAENSVKTWQDQNIIVENAQPQRWQIWANRSVYKTPLLRRLLLENIKAQGDTTAYIDSKIVNQELKLTTNIKKQEYNLEQIDISSKSLIKVLRSEQDQNPRSYPGNLRLQANSYGNFTLVNQVELETYLRGVVPHEITADAPYTAQEAQTIIARTYVLKNLHRFVVDNYQLCADAQCQMYLGLTATSNISDQAIAATKGLVLTYNNQLVDALYSSTTGGLTAPFNDVWNGDDRPYLLGIIDGKPNIWNLEQKSLKSEDNFRAFMNLPTGFNEQGWQTFRWRKTSSLEEIKPFLQKFLTRTKAPLTEFNQIKQIKVVERSKFGRILKLSVETDKGIIELLKDDVRSAFLAPLSTLFYLEPIYNQDKTLTGYEFVGGGLGHGVGLSQTGAYNLAKQGWTSKQILNFYYPGTVIQPMSK